MIAALAGSALAAYLVLDKGGARRACRAPVGGLGHSRRRLAGSSHADAAARIGLRMLFGARAQVGWVGFTWARWVREPAAIDG